MENNYLITGYWGEPHVTAENDRGIHAAIFGSGRFVLPVGQQFKAEFVGNNTIRMYDGKLLDNGAAAGIPAGEYVDVVIANASQGMKRNDLIVFQYEQDASTLVESGKFVVVEGEETADTANDPELTQNDLLTNTAMLDQMPLWRVPVSGVNISDPVQLFTVSKNMTDYIEESEKGEAGGIATLGEEGTVPLSQMPPMDYIPTTEKMVAGGVATLDDSGVVPASQLPDMDYIPISEKGVAGGVATLDENGKLPAEFAVKTTVEELTLTMPDDIKYFNLFSKPICRLYSIGDLLQWIFVDFGVNFKDSDYIPKSFYLEISGHNFDGFCGVGALPHGQYTSDRRYINLATGHLEDNVLSLTSRNANFEEVFTRFTGTILLTNPG